jgi:histone-lysine N-methyltransferase SETMAR
LEAIAKMGWEVLPHHSCSPDLAPSDYHLFGFVKDQLRGQRFETREAIQKAVRQSIRMAGTEFYQNAGRNVYKEVAIMWKNKERSVD